MDKEMVVSSRTGRPTFSSTERCAFEEQIARLRGAGHSVNEVAATLGLSQSTVWRWSRQSAWSTSATAVAQLSRVRIAGPRAEQGLVVRGPRDLCVEGLTISQLAELWARLA